MVLNNDVDTIVAQATPAGRGGVSIIRISGPNVLGIAQQMLGKIPSPRHAENLSFFGPGKDKIDNGIALLFKGPHSFTGEDVLELQGHGGPVVVNQLLQAAKTFGARLANPGEFSLRAFLNNKIDLLQAEAIADLINATSEQAAKSAIRSLQGDFSRVVEAWIESLIKLRMYVEAAIDFPEEEIDFLSDGRIKTQLSALITQVDKALETARQGALLSEGLKVVIAGKPNAGKSSLLNALSGYESAIVTDIPGTTRDVLKEQILIDGLLVHIIDTAGLRIGTDIVEEEGVRRACREIKGADHILWMVDGTTTDEIQPETLFSDWINDHPSNINVTILYNKIDQLKKVSSIKKQEGYSVIFLSVKTGEGVDLLRSHLKEVAGFSPQANEGVFAARSRHLDALNLAKKHLLEGELQLNCYKAGELLAEELRQTQLALEAITGRFSTDDLLGRIFSEFCIGK
jgi:tRNA modification GTPase